MEKEEEEEDGKKRRRQERSFDRPFSRFWSKVFCWARSREGRTEGDGSTSASSSSASPARASLDKGKGGRKRGVSFFFYLGHRRFSSSFPLSLPSLPLFCCTCLSKSGQPCTTQGGERRRRRE